MAEDLRLSAAGAARQAALRSMLMAAVVRRRRRRRSARSALALLLVAAFGLWLAQRDPAPAAFPSWPGPVVRGPDAPLLEVFGNDRGVVARLSVGGAPAAVQMLDDRGLVVVLARQGTPAGVVRTGGRVEVVPRVGEEWLLVP